MIPLEIPPARVDDYSNVVVHQQLYSLVHLLEGNYVVTGPPNNRGCSRPTGHASVSQLDRDMYAVIYHHWVHAQAQEASQQ